MQKRCLIALSLLVALGCSSRAAPPAAYAPLPSSTPEPQSAAAPAEAGAPPRAIDYAAIVQAADRDAADRALDEGRKPAELLAFLQVQAGMRVAELGAGGGYTSELLARAVGDTGTVYAQNSDYVLKRFAEKPLSERLQKPVMKHVVRVDRDFDSPLPDDVHDLDLVVNVLFYHDTVWQKVDRPRMNRAVLAALKPGGTYVIVDHSSAVGKGLSEVETLHRIEESVLKSEIEQAGFRLVGSADFLKNPADTRDWSASPRAAGEKRGTSDRFVLKFQKP
jgi:predicted methyltransferase